MVKQPASCCEHPQPELCIFNNSRKQIVCLTMVKQTASSNEYLQQTPANG